MEALQIIALIGIILATYIYIVKTILNNFSRVQGIVSSLFWGFMLFATLSFLFSPDNDDSQNNYDNCGDNDDDVIYDIEDDYNLSFLDQDDYNDAYDD